MTKNFKTEAEIKCNFRSFSVYLFKEMITTKQDPNQLVTKYSSIDRVWPILYQ